MIRNVLESIGGISVFPAVSLVLFVLVFAGVVVWAIRLNRRHLEHMRHLPLTDDKPDAGDSRHA